MSEIRLILKIFMTCLTLINTITQVLFVVLVDIKMVLLLYFLALTDSKVQEASIF